VDAAALELLGLLAQLYRGRQALPRIGRAGELLERGFHLIHGVKIFLTSHVCQGNLDSMNGHQLPETVTLSRDEAIEVLHALESAAGALSDVAVAFDVDGAIRIVQDKLGRDLPEG